MNDAMSAVVPGERQVPEAARRGWQWMLCCCPLEVIVHAGYVEKTRRPDVDRVLD